MTRTPLGRSRSIRPRSPAPPLSLLLSPALLGLAACAATTPFAEDPEITNHVEDWRDEVIYQVLVDRFANGDLNNDHGVTHDPTNLARYMGGDYQGIIDHVDYFGALGVTTLWISPVVVNVEEDAGIAGYHGYWAQDFTRVNPHFGDMAKLRELVAVMHDHDIKVVVDIVVNHVGQLFYYDINQNGQADINAYYSTDGSDTVDLVTEWDPAWDHRGIQSFTSLGEAGPAPLGWVYLPELNRIPPEPAELWNDDYYNKSGRVTDWGDAEQVERGDFPGGLKDLDTRNPNVQQALIRVYADWIRHTNIDGYRIDTVKHVEHEFWPVFCGAIREQAADMGKEKFILFGEAFDGDDSLIGGYTDAGMLDGMAYFSQKYTVYDGVFRDQAPPSVIADLWAAREANWGQVAQDGGVGVPPVDLPINFLDNHDVPRFLYERDEDSLALALLLLFTEAGLPVLYYGTEQGFDGGNDPTNREPLWTSGFATDGALFDWISALTALRADQEALRRGETSVLWASDSAAGETDAGLFVYQRLAGLETVVVALNTRPDQTSRTEKDGVAMSVPYAPGTRLSAIFPPGVAQSYTVGADGLVAIELPPLQGVVLAPVD